MNVIKMIIYTILVLLLYSVGVADLSAAISQDSNKASPGRVKIGTAPLAKLASVERPMASFLPAVSTSPVSLGMDGNMASQSPGMQVGLTTFDIQHYGRMNRQVDWRGTQNIHFSWTVQTESVYPGNAGTAYEIWDANDGTLEFTGPSGGCDIHPRLGHNMNYSEHCGLDIAPDGRAIIVNHHSYSGNSLMTTVYPDFLPLACFFSPYLSRLPDSLAEYGTYEDCNFVWPSMEWHVYGDDTVTHVVAHEAGEPIGSHMMHYFRRVGGPESATWDYPPVSIDTVPATSGTVVASRVSSKVAIVWLANPGNFPGDPESADRGLQRLNDVYAMTSTDMGLNWSPKFNITQWDSSQSGWAAHADLSALITTDDYLHIIWDARRTEPDPYGGLGYYPHFYGSRLFHWDEFNNEIRTVKDANWDPPFEDDWCHGGDWNEMSIVKMQLSECDGKLYALFVQFNDIANGITDDCHQRAFSRHEVSGTANGELYISVSDNDGYNWDIARNLTNSYSSHCDSAPSLGGTLECDADMWPSMSRFGMYVTSGDFTGVPVVDPSGSYADNYFLDVFYVNDKHPGAATCDAGIWTSNPLKWFRLPCVEPVSNPLLTLTPIAYGYGPPAWTKPGVVLGVNVTLENVGNAPLSFSSTDIVELTGPAGWLNYMPTPTTISHLAPNSMTLSVDINAGGIVTQSGVILDGMLIFTTDSPTSPDTLFVHAIVVDSLQIPEYASIRTQCKPLYISNTGQLGNNGAYGESGHDWGNLQMYDDCDITDNGTGGDDDIACYLYEAAPFIARINAIGDTLLDTYFGMADWMQNNGFLPTEGLTVDSVSYPNYQYAATGRFITQDSAIGLECEYFAPSEFDSCGFIIQRLKLYNLTDQDLTDLYIGEVMDWDIPSDSGRENGSDFDVSRKAMYMYGAEYGPDDIANNDCILADERYGGLAYYAGARIPHDDPDPLGTDSFPNVHGMWTAMNADWLQGGRFYEADLYERLESFYGYESWEATNPMMEDSMYQDLHMVSVFANTDLGVGDTLIFVKTYATTSNGLSDLEDSFDKARTWIESNGVFAWPPMEEDCCTAWGVPGDVNKSGNVDILDITALISYLYNNGPDLTDGCLELMDANGSDDIDIADAGYLVQYLFMSGPEPVCPGTKNGKEVAP